MTKDRENKNDTKQDRQPRPSLELLRRRGELVKWKAHNRMRAKQWQQVADMGRPKPRLLRIQDTQGSDGSLRVNAASVASLSKNGRLAFARGAECFVKKISYNRELISTMQRQLTDKEKKQVSDFLDIYMALHENGIWVTPTHAAAMLTCGTTDGRPYVEKELTEQDSFSRPWVMVRDHETASWHGPAVLVDKLPNGRYVCRTQCQKGVNAWLYCRRATEDEIAEVAHQLVSN